MRILWFICFIPLAACSPDLTSVQQTPADENTNCEFLGPVSGMELSGPNSGNDPQSALDEVRSEVAARGGNAFSLVRSTTDFAGTITQADAYLCP